MTLPVTPPNLYFRIREPGAAIFRVRTETQRRRLEMDLIAVVNARTGEIKSQSDGPTKTETAEIEAWVVSRHEQKNQRDNAELLAFAEKLNQTAQWIQTRAEKRSVAKNADGILFALHDLRAVLVRRLADTNDKLEGEE